MKKFLTPAQGLLVRNHQDKMRPLPEEGAEVEFDTTWARRMRDGDVVESQKPRAKQSAPAKQPEKAKKEG